MGKTPLIFPPGAPEAQSPTDDTDVLGRRLAGLTEREARLRRIFEQSVMGIILRDAQGNILDVNAMALRLLGYDDKAELLGQNARILVHPDDQQAVPVSEAPRGCRGGGLTSLERRYRCKDGSWLPASAHFGLLDPERDIYQVMFQDISARKADEAAREAALAEARAASRAKSAFLANMSHEIRTPLNGIMGMLQLALDAEPTPEQRDYMTTAMDSAKALLRILSDVLDVSRIDTGRIVLRDEVFNLDETLAPVIDSLRHEAHIKGLEFSRTIDPATPLRLRGDAARLRQVLYQLTANAIKYTPKGRVTLAVAPTRAAQAADGLEIDFAVADTGIGIPADKLSEVFEAFSQVDPTLTRPYGGTGLGLAIVKGLTELMGGRIALCSQEGEGTEVRVRLRFALADGPVRTASPVVADCLSGLRVLVAEDEAINRVTIRAMLRKLGCCATLAENGREALEILAGETVDCVLMDVRMPLLDGLSATRAIRGGAAGPDKAGIPIIALTAHALAEDKETALAAGVNGYLSKPVDLDVLARALAAFLPCPSHAGKNHTF